MASDRSLALTTLVLFGVSTLAWIISFALGMAMVMGGMNMTLMFVVSAIMFVARYGALIVGTIAILRSKRWEAGTPLLVTTWIVVGWYALLFLRDLLLLVLLVFVAGMIGPTDPSGRVSPPSVPVSIPRPG